MKLLFADKNGYRVSFDHSRFTFVSHETLEAILEGISKDKTNPFREAAKAFCDLIPILRENEAA